MYNTANEYIKGYEALWGEDEVNRLLDSGYTPSMLVDDNGEKRWTWIHTLDADRQICYDSRGG